MTGTALPIKKQTSFLAIMIPWKNEGGYKILLARDANLGRVRMFKPILTPGHEAAPLRNEHPLFGEDSASPHKRRSDLLQAVTKHPTSRPFLQWNLPGGANNPNLDGGFEDPMTALRREVTEELMLKNFDQLLEFGGVSEPTLLGKYYNSPIEDMVYLYGLKITDQKQAPFMEYLQKLQTNIDLATAGQSRYKFLREEMPQYAGEQIEVSRISTFSLDKTPPFMWQPAPAKIAHAFNWAQEKLPEGSPLFIQEHPFGEREISLPQGGQFVVPGGMINLTPPQLIRAYMAGHSAYFASLHHQTPEEQTLYELYWNRRPRS